MRFWELRSAIEQLTRDGCEDNAVVRFAIDYESTYIECDRDGTPRSVTGDILTHDSPLARVRLLRNGSQEVVLS